MEEKTKKKNVFRIFLSIFDKKQKRFLIWVLIFLIVVFAYVLIKDFMGEKIFWLGFFQNFYSDLIIAVVIGLYFSLWQKLQDENNRKKQILFLLKEEINKNKERLDRGRKRLLRDNPVGNMPGMRFEYWEALSGGGELKWIVDNPKLIQVLSNFYQTIRMTNHFEIRFVELNKSFDKVSTNGIKEVLNKAYEKIDELINELLEMKEFNS